MAELVDATDLKSVIRMRVWVRLPLRALFNIWVFAAFPEQSPAQQFNYVVLVVVDVQFKPRGFTQQVFNLVVGQIGFF